MDHSSASIEAGRTGPEGFVRSVITGWALFGGAVLVGLVLMTAASVTANWIINQPIPGDFEIVKLGIAVAAFAFLPYAQMTHANVTVDIFTTWASKRLVAVMTLGASLIALSFSVLLLWRMSLGMLDYMKYEEFTPIVSIPIWTVFPPILISLALLAAACVLTTLEGCRGFGK